MSKDNPPTHSLFTQVEVSSSMPTVQRVDPWASSEEQTRLLRQMAGLMEKQNTVLEELLAQTTASQKQRANELNQWKQANPDLARSCRMAADALGKVQANFLDQLTREVVENAEGLADGEFLLTEFVDRFGPRLAHLNGVLQVLSQLAMSAEQARNTQQG